MNTLRRFDVRWGGGADWVPFGACGEVRRLTHRRKRRLRLHRGVESVERYKTVLEDLFIGPADHPIGPNDRILEVALHDQIELIESVEPFDWPELSDAVAEMCERARRAASNALGERLGRDQLVLACAIRLKGSPHFDACAKFLTGEVNDLSAKMRAAEALVPSDQPGGTPNRYREYRYALNTWLHDASALIGGH